MSDGPEWFAQKRYGYGAGLPISWQGWALSFAFGLAVFAASITFAERPAILFAIIAPLLALFIIICARTTRGGWRWRWGDPD